MLKMDKGSIDYLEHMYPGFRQMVERWEAAELPSCPSCDSEDTARVSAGLVGQSINLAAATTKIKLLANGHPADYFCNECGVYFNVGGARVASMPAGGLTLAGRDVLGAIETSEGLQALCDEIGAALGIKVVNDADDEG